MYHHVARGPVSQCASNKPFHAKCSLTMSKGKGVCSCSGNQRLGENAVIASSWLHPLASPISLSKNSVFFLVSVIQMKLMFHTFRQALLENLHSVAFCCKTFVKKIMGVVIIKEELEREV